MQTLRDHVLLVHLFLGQEFLEFGVPQHDEVAEKKLVILLFFQLEKTMHFAFVAFGQQHSRPFSFPHLIPFDQHFLRVQVGDQSEFRELPFSLVDGAVVDLLQLWKLELELLDSLYAPQQALKTNFLPAFLALLMPFLVQSIYQAPTAVTFEGQHQSHSLPSALIMQFYLFLLDLLFALLLVELRPLIPSHPDITQLDQRPEPASLQLINEMVHFVRTFDEPRFIAFYAELHLDYDFVPIKNIHQDVLCDVGQSVPDTNDLEQAGIVMVYF